MVYGAPLPENAHASTGVAVLADRIASPNVQLPFAIPLGFVVVASCAVLLTTIVVCAKLASAAPNRRQLANTAGRKAKAACATRQFLKSPIVLLIADPLPGSAIAYRFFRDVLTLSYWPRKYHARWTLKFYSVGVRS